jgi:hypothetical protein
MCFSAEASFVTAGILVLMGISMMVRRLPLDKILAGFIFALAAIQIVEFGLHTKTITSPEGGRMLFIVLLAQCSILALSTWTVVGGVVSGGLAIFSTALLVLGVVLTTYSTFSAAPGNCRHIEWSRDGKSLLGNGFGILYLVGLFAPLVLVTAFAPSKSGAMAGFALILYGVFSALYVCIAFPPSAFSSMWCFLSVGFGILAWIMGCVY